MNTATKNLEEDHVHILKLIDVMESMAGTEEPDINHLTEVVYLIRNYADGLHHAKEEELFFPLLGERGFSSQQGPVAVMLHEHVEGRNFVRGIADNILLYREGGRSALKEIFRNMRGYAELLRNHISKENNILFRMADNVLSVEDHADLLLKFGTAEKSHISGMNPDDFISRIDRLASFYKV